MYVKAPMTGNTLTIATHSYLIQNISCLNLLLINILRKTPEFEIMHCFIGTILYLHLQAWNFDCGDNQFVNMESESVTSSHKF
jgi:hypothetical protein